MNGNLNQRTAITDTLPTVFGYIGIGIAFGIVGKAAGFSPFVVTLMSLLIYAGSAQFITVTMLVSHSPILSIIFSTFLVNARMILMSMTLAPFFKKESLAKNLFLGTLLTDESFALGMNKLNHTGGKLNFSWMNTANWIAYLTWVISTFIGSVIGNLITDPNKYGLDFAIVAMFIGLLYLQVISDRSLHRLLQLLVILFTLILVYLGLIVIPSNLLIVIVTLLGCGFGVIIKHAFF
ncbi:azaleucine resistance protein AzlC [Enterococcus sp. AZ191]|uniref:AzlC family ABC transporter permease n=1 Tax=Enterococcus sp. AZ191 TaxID=2774639 RepID=UPI003F276F44